MIRGSHRRLLLGIGCLVGILGAGCGRGDHLETQYGSSHGPSINGSEVLAEMFREEGHNVKTAYRLTRQMSDWADLIVRFAPRPGVPDEEEGDWYFNWLTKEGGHRLIYIVNDFDVQETYWNEVLKNLGSDVTPEVRQLAEARRDAAKDWVKELPEKPRKTADPDDWFHLDHPVDPPKLCKKLSGPWADGLTAEQASITIHEPFAEGGEEVLLSGDGHPFVIEWPVMGDNKVLAVSNGSFVVNATLVDPSRRKLAERILSWASEGDGPLNVAFVDGRAVLADTSRNPSIWDLLTRVASFRWVAIQMGILGLAACLARAPRLGRPLPERSAGLDRPSAHAEALGELLFRVRSRGVAANAIEQYESWRHGRSGSS